MAGNLTDTAELQMLRWLLNVSPTYTPVSTKLALLTTAPSGDDGTTGAIEVSGGSYVRQSITWAAPSSGSITTGADITFPTATASWGTIVGIQVWDTGGTTCLFYGNLSSPKTINTGDIFKIVTGNLTLTLD